MTSRERQAGKQAGRQTGRQAESNLTHDNGSRSGAPSTWGSGGRLMLLLLLSRAKLRPKHADQVEGSFMISLWALGFVVFCEVVRD